MSRAFCTLSLLLAMGLLMPAQAEQGRKRADNASANAPANGDADGAQRRRDALRETLRYPVDDSTVDYRRLSDQQKAELRQQLRQQRADNTKP